jgi:uroporphyrin-3 C-methyltransferase
MTNSIDAKTPSPSKKSPSTANPTSKPKRTVTKLFIPIAVGCFIYSIVINFQLRQGTTQQINTLLSQFSTLKQQQIDTERQVDATKKLISSSEETLHNKVNTLDKTVQTALRQRSYQTQDWLLLKARYCLELAQINAHWSDNSDTTIALLHQADILLADIHDQRAYPIRQAITNEIGILHSMPKLDIAGLLSQLDAAQSIVAHLELKPAVAPVENSPTDARKKSTSSWHARLKESVSLLEKLVVVRRHDEDILPLPSPIYESMLREGIRLNLQEAQWAVLQNNDDIYHFSLTQALNNIGRTFAPNMAATDALIKQLNSLQQVHLAQPKPILEQALPLVNQLIESKNSPTPPVAGENS